MASSSPTALQALADQINELARRIDAKQDEIRLAEVVTANDTGVVSVRLVSDVSTILEGIPVHGGYIPEVGHLVLLVGSVAPVAFSPVEGFPSAEPPQVVGVNVEPSVGALVVSWQAATDAKVRWNRGTYELQIDTTASFDSNNLQFFASAQTSKTVGGLTNGTPYFVQVRAISYRGVPGEWSVVSAPVAPTVTALNHAIGSSEIADAAIDDPRLLNAFTVVEGANLIQNPSFATSTAGWSVTGATLAQDLTTSRLPLDAQSGKLTSTVSSGQITVTSPLLPAIEGGTYVARFPILSHTMIRQVGVELVFYASDGSTILGGSDSAISSDWSSTASWMTYAARGTAPTGTAFVQLVAIIGINLADVTAGEIHNFTGAELRRTSHIVGDLRTAEVGPRVEIGLRDGYPSVVIFSEEAGETDGARISSEIDVNSPTNDVNVPVMRIRSPGFAFLDDPAPLAVVELRSLDRLNPGGSRAELRTLTRVVRIRDPIYPSRGGLSVLVDESPVVARLANVIRTNAVDTTYSYNSDASAVADIDAANLVATFVAPHSGEVEVRFGAYIATSASGSMIWGLRDASNVVVAMATHRVWDSVTTAVGAVLRASSSIPVTGLTPGQSYTWKWTWHATAAGYNLSMGYGPTTGPIVMSVWGVFS